MKYLTNDRMVRWFSWLQRLNEQRYIYCIRNGFISIMPIMIIGAFATVFTSMPIPAYQQVMTDVFGAQWSLFGTIAFNGTTQIVSLLIAFSIGLNLAAWYNRGRQLQVHGGISGMISVCCYAILSLPLDSVTGLSFEVTSVTGLFVAIVVGVVSSEVFVRCSMYKHTKMMITDDPNTAVPQSFNAVLPAAITVVLFVVLRLAMVLSGYRGGLSTLVYDALQLPFQNGSRSFFSTAMMIVVVHVLWLFGIHGTNVLDEVVQNVYDPAAVQNVEQVAMGLPASNLFTRTMLDVFVYMGGAGCTLGLLIALLIWGKTNGQKQLYKYALPTSLFNINEPVIFGVPIVLNPIYAIPFVLVPLATFFVTTFAMYMRWVPFTSAEVTWSTPIFFSGYLATGSVAGIVLQVVNLAVSVAIYAPFVYLGQKLGELRFRSSYSKLSDYVVNDYDPTAQQLLLRTDDIGAVARRLAGRFETALKEGEMFLNYQPIVDARGNTLHSVEALLRWRNPQQGFINPMVTVALAEETGNAGKLGLWILEQAIRQRALWTKQNMPDFHVSVNMTSTQLQDPLFHEKVQKLLEKHQVPPHQLQLEIVETSSLVESKVTKGNLIKLSRLGVTIAMDDFGVGHSSLLYLRSHPITTIKIDASLSTDIIDNPASLHIISTIRELAEVMGMQMIIEHVDNQEQLNLLLGVNTYLIQGYLFSPPMPGKDLHSFTKKLTQMPMAACTLFSPAQLEKMAQEDLGITE